MAKRNFDEWDSERVKVEDTEEDQEVIETPEVYPTVRLRLLKQLTLKYIGPHTGKLYTFSGIGSELDVDERDAGIMIEKKGNKACCPNSVGPQPYFEIVR